jgi:hypothetical protein
MRQRMLGARSRGRKPQRSHCRHALPVYGFLRRIEITDSLRAGRRSSRRSSRRRVRRHRPNILVLTYRGVAPLRSKRQGLVIGGSARRGTLTFHDRRYPLSIGGLLPAFCLRPMLMMAASDCEFRHERPVRKYRIYTPRKGNPGLPPCGRNLILYSSRGECRCVPLRQRRMTHLTFWD